MRWYSSAIGSLTLRIMSPSPHTSSAVGRIFAPAVTKSSSGMDDPFPAPASMSTWWPPRTSSCTPAGVIATRYSWFLISRGIPTFMAVLPDGGASLLFRGISGAEPLIPLCPRSIPRQYGQGRDPVVQLTGEDLAHRLVQRQPGRHQLGFLALRHEVAFALRDELQVAGEEDTQALGAEAGRAVVVREHPPVPRPVPGLLEQLPPRRRPRQLPGDVAQAGRDLPQQPPHRMTVLPDQEHLLNVIQGEHRDRARVNHHVPFGQFTVGHPDFVGPHGDQPTAHQLGRGDDGPVRRLVPDVHALAAARAPALADLDRARAAAISPLNSGCGRVGRDRNSGCAWVPTKKGCSASSANSTRCRSGESPEKTRPACSSTLRYALLTSYLCRCRSSTSVLPYISSTRVPRSEEHTSELQSQFHLVCRLL